MKEIVLFGAGGHAKVICETASQNGFSVVGVCIPGKFSGEWEGIPYISMDDALKVRLGIVGIGDNFTRQKVTVEILKSQPTFDFVSIVHPSAIVSSKVKIGRGVSIHAGAVINARSALGDHSVINSGAIIEHDVTLGSFSFIGPRAVLGGNVTIGESAFIGMGSVVLQGLTIGHQSLLGAGSLLLNDIPPLSLFYGSPAQKQRDRNPTEKYI